MVRQASRTSRRCGFVSTYITKPKHFFKVPQLSNSCKMLNFNLWITLWVSALNNWAQSHSVGQSLLFSGALWVNLRCHLGQLHSVKLKCYSAWAAVALMWFKLYFLEIKFDAVQYIPWSAEAAALKSTSLLFSFSVICVVLYFGQYKVFLTYTWQL